jgi:hypothetical protein
VRVVRIVRVVRVARVVRVVRIVRAVAAIARAEAEVAEVVVGEVGLKRRAWQRGSSCSGVEQFSVIKLIAVIIAVLYLVNSGEGGER